MKNDATSEQFLTTYRPTPWDQLPDLGLYMDQVILYIDQRCRALYSTQKNFITPAMINNYVKSGLVKRPSGKKYDRIQLAQLMMLCTLKQAASLDEMKQLMTPPDLQTVEQVYAGFCQTQAYVIKALATRPTEATAMEYAIEAASFRILCAEKLASEKASLQKQALKLDSVEESRVDE